MENNSWFYEEPLGMSVALKIKEHLYTGKSKFQKIDVIDTYALGKVLLLDGLVMTTDKDEFYYHETISHSILSSHPNPKKVLIIGGGDGGTIREVLKYDSIEEIELIEIDEEVINVSKKFFPEISCELSNPKVKIKVQDAVEYLKNSKDSHYDAVICDCTDPDPDGIASGLISKDFYKNIFRTLKDDGVYIAQSGSPYLQEREFKTSLENIRSVFKFITPLISIIPTYPGSLWSFLIASKKELSLKIKNYPTGKTKFWNKNIHEKLFATPTWIEEKYFSFEKIT